MHWIRQSSALCRKDLLVEWRSRHSLAATVAFGAASCLLTGLSIDASLWNPSTRAGLFWILYTFSLILGIGRLFSAETERHTDWVIRATAGPDAVFTGKFLAHAGFGMPVMLVFQGLFALFFGHIPVDLYSWMLLTLLSVPAFAALFTLLGAVSASAGVKGSMLSILSIPLLIPLILLLIRCSRYAYSIGWMEGTAGDFLSLGAYSGAMLTSGFLLFEGAWEQ